MSEFDPYKELGLGRAASDAEVKAAHRKAAKASHPDSSTGDRDKFERVTKAALVLRDPDRRKRYDETGELDDGPSVDQELLAAISLADQLLMAVIEQLDPDHEDVIDCAIFAGKKSIEVNQVTRQNEVKRKAKLERLAGRLKHKGRGRDYLASAMSDKVANAQQAINSAEKSIEVHERAIDILRQYSWEFDARPSHLWPMDDHIFRGAGGDEFQKFGDEMHDSMSRTWGKPED